MNIRVNQRAKFMLGHGCCAKKVRYLKFKRVNALEFCGKHGDWNLSGFKLNKVCALMAEEMMGCLQAKRMALCGSYFVTGTETSAEAFCLSSKAQQVVEDVKLVDCKLNGELFSYRTLTRFLCGLRHVIPVKREPAIAILGEPFWKYNDDSHNAFICIQDVMKKCSFLDMIPSIQDFPLSALPKLKTLVIEGVTSQDGSLSSLLQRLSGPNRPMITLKESPMTNESHMLEEFFIIARDF